MCSPFCTHVFNGSARNCNSKTGSRGLLILGSGLKLASIPPSTVRIGQLVKPEKRHMGVTHGLRVIRIPVISLSEKLDATSVNDSRGLWRVLPCHLLLFKLHHSILLLVIEVAHRSAFRDSRKDLTLIFLCVKLFWGGTLRECLWIELCGLGRCGVFPFLVRLTFFFYDIERVR